MRKMLTQKQAWLHISKCFHPANMTTRMHGIEISCWATTGAYPEPRYERCLSICPVLNYLFDRGRISSQTYTRMKDKINKELQGRIWLASITLEGAKVRRDFALKTAKALK